MEVNVGEVCIPGDRLADCEKCTNGYGTYTRHGYICASLTGVVEIEKDEKSNKSIVSVKPKRKAQTIPSIGSVVVCKITQLTSRFARCHIISIDDNQLSDPLRGLIRKEDVRSIDRDRIEMHKCFRPGDLTLAKVLSLGDAACYLLSTAEPELGVVVAKSEKSRENMLPLSHTQMQCPATSAKESRKVARIQREHIKFVEE